MILNRHETCEKSNCSALLAQNALHLQFLWSMFVQTMVCVIIASITQPNVTRLTLSQPHITWHLVQDWSQTFPAHDCKKGGVSVETESVARMTQVHRHLPVSNT